MLKKCVDIESGHCGEFLQIFIGSESSSGGTE
jgi:hypothetical protein